MDKQTLIQLAKEVYQLTLLFPNKEPLRYRMREAADDIVAGFIMKRNDYLQDLKSNLEIMDGFFDIASCQDWTSPMRVNAVRDKYQAVSVEISLIRGQVKPSEIRTPAAEPPIASPQAFIEPEFAPQASVAPIADGGVICPPPPAAEPLLPYPLPRSENQIIPANEPKNQSIAKELAQEEIPEAAAVKPETEPEGDLGDDIDEGDESGTGLTSGQILRQNRILTFLKEKGGAQVWEIQKIFPNVSKRTIRRDFRSMLKQGLIERFGERNTTSYKLKINIS